MIYLEAQHALNHHSLGHSRLVIPLMIFSAIALLLTVLILPIAASSTLQSRQVAQGSFSTRSVLQDNNSEQTLELGKPLRRTVTGRGVDVFKIDLKQGQLLKIVVTSHSIKVINVKLYGVHREQLIDAYVGDNFKKEPITYETDESGAYHLEIETWGRSDEDYEIIADVKVINENSLELLELGKLVEREIKKGEKHSYRMKLTRGQFMTVVAETFKDNVETTLVDPNGKRLVKVDQHDYYDKMPISWLAETAGTYRIVVRTSEDSQWNTGQYQIKLEDLHVATPQDRSRLKAEEALAEGFALETDYSLAIARFESALPLWRDLKDSYWESLTLDKIGEAYEKLGERQKALDFFNQALSLWRAIGNRREEARTLNRVGSLHKEAGENQKALEELNRALSLYIALGDDENEAKMLNNLGEFCKSLTLKQKAIDYYTQLLALERAQNNHYKEAQTLNIIGELYQSLDQKAKALEYYALMLKLKTLEGEPNRSEADRSIESEFIYAARKHKVALSDLVRIRGVDARYGYRLEAEISSFETLRKSLEVYRKNTAVLFYEYEGDTLFAWLISTKGLQAYKQTKISRTRLDTAISNLRGSLGVELLQATRAPHLRASFVFSRKNRQSSHLPLKRSVDEITRILLPEPIAHSLMSVEQLIVVPTLGIGTVPFPLLQPFGSSLMIVDQMSVSIAPSLFDIGQQIEPWDPAILESPKDSGRHYPALVVGNPYFLTYGDWVFPPLSGAEQEARAVARMLKVKPLIGKNATKKAVKTSAVRASILYFATHAGADASDGFLALSADSPDAEKWTGQEIHNSRFENAYLAVLSACQTGLGMVHDGGINGVARSFQMGGVPRVVMSLWRVDDAATAELMQHFIGHLKQGMPAEALRQAMLDERKRHPDPSQWASFVLFGTPR